MTNEPFLAEIDEHYMYEHAKKLVALSEAANAVYSRFVEPLTPEELDLKAALEQLEGGEE